MAYSSGAKSSKSMLGWHDNLCLAMYDWLSEIRPRYTSSAAYRASLLISALHSVYVVPIVYSIFSGHSFARLSATLVLASVGIPYGWWSERRIEHLSSDWISRRNDPPIVAWRRRWRAILLGYAFFTAVAAFAAFCLYVALVSPGVPRQVGGDTSFEPHQPRVIANDLGSQIRARSPRTRFGTPCRERRPEGERDGQPDVAAVERLPPFGRSLFRS